MNPSFTGPVILGEPTQWFNPNACLPLPPNSGSYGNLGRNTLIGPGLATWDFSTLKETALGERFGLQFRVEIFNLLNRGNFNIPNLITFILGDYFQQYFDDVAADPTRTEAQVEKRLLAEL